VDRAIRLLLLLLPAGLAFPSTVWSQQCDPWSTAEIRLLTRTIDASQEVAIDTVFPAEEDLRIHTLIRFQSPPTMEVYEGLDVAVIKLLECLKNCGYLVSLARTDWTSYTHSNSKAEVRLMGSLEPVDKISIYIQNGVFRQWARVGLSRLKVLIEFHRDVSWSEARAELERLQGYFHVEPTPHGPRGWATVVEINEIEDIASADTIRRIEQGPTPPIPLNNTVRPMVNTDIAQDPDFSGPRPEYRLDGQGARLGICDLGVDEGHPDFKMIDGLGEIDTETRFYRCRDDSHEHGTRVASIAAGSGWASEDEGLPGFSLRGQAPEAEIGDFEQIGSEVGKYYEVLVTFETDVTNHSYHQSATVYDGHAAWIDEIVRGHALYWTRTGGSVIPARPQVWGAGNTGFGKPLITQKGYHSVLTSAKNTISVGSIDSIDGRATRTTSLGPTFDGRIKPDLVAPGCRDSIVAVGTVGDGIVSADKRSDPGDDYGYASLCGTSAAAPVVTGIIGLMIDQIQSKYSAFPELFPSTYKAMLINTAVDQVKATPYGDDREDPNPDTEEPVLYHAGPDFVTGFGLVDARAARDIVTKSNQWKQSTIATSNRLHRWCIYVPKGSAELKVTLAWDDEPGCTLEPDDVPKLSNDLDLRLVSPSGETTLPWTVKALPVTIDPLDQNDATDEFSPSDLPAERGIDRLNNVEMASVCSPEHGVWRVVVDAGYRLCLGTSQPYSLVSTHEFLTWCPVEPLCERYPWICPSMEICSGYPWICRIAEPKEIEIKDRLWSVDPTGPTPISQFCRFGFDCPTCEGKSWRFCPGWEMELRGVPEGLGIVVFDQKGQIIQEIDPPEMHEPNRVIRVENTRPGQDFFLGFVDRSGNPFPDAFPAEVDIRPLESMP
jgi:subtilisin family serine protease